MTSEQNLILRELRHGRQRAISKKVLAKITGIAPRRVEAIIRELIVEHGCEIASSCERPMGYFLIDNEIELRRYRAQLKGGNNPLYPPLKGGLTGGKLKKLHVLARKLGWSSEELHDFAGVDSLKTLSNRQAGDLLTRMEGMLYARGTPNIPIERVAGTTRAKILKYRYLLGWDAEYFWRFVERVVQHNLPRSGSDFQKFNWCSLADGRKILEAVKAVYKRQQKGEQQHEEITTGDVDHNFIGAGGAGAGEESPCRKFLGE